MSADKVLTLSVVIPLMNEADNVRPLCDELAEKLAELGRPYEVILIDDGSTDGTFDRLREVASRHAHFRLIRFRRNFGKTAALSAGFAQASGDIIITMDGDLQNDPADFPQLLEKIDAGHDVISGWRQQRRESFIHRRLPSLLANHLISLVTGVRLHDYGCGLKVYRAEVLKQIKLYGEMHRFIPAVLKSVGVSVIEVPVNDRARQHGVSKFGGLDRTFKVLLDLIMVFFFLGYATRPSRFFGGIGMLMGGAGFAICTYLSILRLVYDENIGQRPLLFLGILLFIVSVQLISTGLVSELIIRTYYEGQNKPTYLVAEGVNLSD